MSKILVPFFKRRFAAFQETLKGRTNYEPAFPILFSRKTHHIVQITTTPMSVGVSTDSKGEEFDMYLFQVTDGQSQFWMTVKKEWLTRQLDKKHSNAARYSYFTVRGLRVWIVPTAMFNQDPAKISFEFLSITDLTSQPYTMVFQPDIFNLKSKFLATCAPPAKQLTIINSDFTRLLLRPMADAILQNNGNQKKNSATNTVRRVTRFQHQIANVRLSKIPVVQNKGGQSLPRQNPKSADGLFKSKLKLKPKPVPIPTYSLSDSNDAEPVSLHPSTSSDPPDSILDETVPVKHSTSFDIEGLKNYSPKLTMWKGMYPLDIKFVPIPIRHEV